MEINKFNKFIKESNYYDSPKFKLKTEILRGEGEYYKDFKSLISKFKKMFNADFKLRSLESTEISEIDMGFYLMGFSSIFYDISISDSFTSQIENLFEEHKSEYFDFTFVKYSIVRNSLEIDFFVTPREELLSYMKFGLY